MAQVVGTDVDPIDLAERHIINVAIILDFVDKYTPHLEDEVTVEVIGQPGARKSDLYYLALNTAYGLARPGVSGIPLLPAPGLVMIEYDAADNWVRATLRYRVGIIDLVTTGFANIPSFLIRKVLGNPPAMTAAGAAFALPLISGPPETVIGGEPRLPFLGPLNVPFPKGLPFTGKPVLTTYAKTLDPNPAVRTPGIIDSANPQPSGDGRSRGSIGAPTLGDLTANYLVPMIFAALTDPGSVTLELFQDAKPNSNGGQSVLRGGG
jgi:hypothetical protein